MKPACGLICPILVMAALHGEAWMYLLWLAGWVFVTCCLRENFDD